MEEDGTVSCPIKMPSGTRHVNEVVCGTGFETGQYRVCYQAEFSNFQLEKSVGEREALEKEDGSLFVKQTVDDSGTVGGNMVEPKLF
jgi:hypothetical protein